MEKMTNKVELTGNAGINPEIINLKEGRKVAHFTMATTDSYKNQNGEWIKETTWHKIVMWNKVADQAQTLIKKGSHLNLIGKIVNRNFTDDKDVKHYITEILAFSFEIVKKEKQEDAFAA
jgi:single-strand DNA-binding protein